MINIFKKRVLARDPQYGLFVVSHALQTAEALADSGFDYLVFDVEHSPSSLPDLHAQLTALAASKTASVVRLAALDPTAIKHYLDLGASALMVPNIATAEQARAAIRCSRYPTAGGLRGVGGTMRATHYGRDKSYFANAVENTCMLLQIESREGLEQLEDICAVDGVDMVFFGPADLSADMGLMGQPGHPDVVQAIVNGIRRANALGVAAGVMASAADSQRYVDAGATLVILGSDLGLLVRAADELAARFSAAPSAAPHSHQPS